MVATPIASPTLTDRITWDKLPNNYVLPDDPVDNINQPPLAEALGDGLTTLGLITATTLTPTNYGICATLDGQIIVKAPDWAFIPHITVPRTDIERSYTPHLQGEPPILVIEFLSATDGGEYSGKQVPPYGKWFFYERILQVPTYVIFDPDGGLLELYHLQNGQYILERPNPEGRHWLAAIGLFLGPWRGTRGDRSGYWLRWWTADEQLVLWDREATAQAQEQAQQAQDQAEQTQQQAEQERQRAEQQRQRAEEAEAALAAERERLAEMAAELERLRARPAKE